MSPRNVGVIWLRRHFQPHHTRTYAHGHVTYANRHILYAHPRPSPCTYRVLNNRTYRIIVSISDANIGPERLLLYLCILRIGRQERQLLILLFMSIRNNYYSLIRTPRSLGPPVHASVFTDGRTFCFAIRTSRTLPDEFVKIGRLGVDALMSAAPLPQ